MEGAYPFIAFAVFLELYAFGSDQGYDINVLFYRFDRILGDHSGLLVKPLDTTYMQT